MNNLAAVVAKPDAEAAIASLSAEGVYDDSRKVVAHGDEAVELPILTPPSETAVFDVIRQQSPERRTRTLCDLLAAEGWTTAELELAPTSWAVIGSVLLVQLSEETPRPEEVGEALLTLHGEAETVLAREGISGELREPTGTVLAGTDDTETIHTEHGTKYALDLSQVMFSPGNQAERVRMGEVVEAGDRVFDMFAGIGYFTLPMARAGAHVTATERNPNAFRFLAENAQLNDVTDRVDAVLADCRDVEVTADRVVMGYYDAHEYLDVALAALISGGVLHMHETTPEPLLWERPIERLTEATEQAGRSVDLDKRKVKSHSEGVWHVVVDARID